MYQADNAQYKNQEPSPAEIWQPILDFVTDPKHAAGFTAIATIVMAITTIVYTVYSRQQWRAIQNQTSLMREQTVNTLAAVITQLNPNPDPVNEPNLLNPEPLNWRPIGISFANVGKVSSGKFVATAVIKREHIPGYGILGHPENGSVSEQIVRPDDPTNPPTSDRPRIEFSTTFNQTDRDDIRSMKEAVEISGNYVYDNGFGDSISRQFCYLFVFLPPHEQPVEVPDRPPAVMPGGPTWGYCPDVNRKVHIASQWKEKPNTDHSQRNRP